MSQFQPQPHTFSSKGINLRYPVDKQPAGSFPYLMNVRALVESTLQPRNGTQLIADTTSALPITALRRLNNSIAGTYARIMVSGGNLYSGIGAFGLRDAGYAGNSALVPFRPDQSPEPWMYVADANKMRKVRVDGTNYQMGVTPPVSAPVTTYGVPSYNVIEAFDAVGAWVNSGSAGALATLSRINTTIAAILYDSGASGWASIAPTAADSNLQPGMFINFAAERVKVRNVYQPITNSTISAISYDVGTTGLCCIQLTSSSSGLIPTCMVQVGGEYVRVLSVTVGPNGLPSFRCNATGTHAAGDAVNGVINFRAYTVGTYAAGAALTKLAVTSTVGTGLGILSAPNAQNLNVLTNPLGGNSRPLTPNDYLHISVLVDNPGNIVAGRVYLDIDSTVNDFQHNAYYYEFRASDFQASVSGALTALSAGQLAIQRQIIDNSIQQDYQNNQDIAYGYQPVQYYPTPVYDTGQGVSVSGEGTSTSSTQQIPGTSQWTELVIKVSDLLKGRIGADQSRSLANVAVISVQLNVTAATVLVVDSWWVGGGYGPDVGSTGSPLLHAYRYRSSLTGARSNHSPIVRSGLNPTRERAVVNVVASTDPQVDKIDVFHFGAGLDEWRLTAIAPNTTGAVNDDIDALTTAVNDPMAFDDFLPFPTSDIPHLGTCNVIGTTVDWVSGDKFNLNWVAGSEVVVNGLTCTLHAPPKSTIKLFLTESAGAAAATPFLIPEATIQGTPLKAMWGPFGGTDIGNVMFAVGDVNQPGNLYWTQPSSPDTASDKAFIEVTSPSEPLINGFTYDAKSYVFSSERLFGIYPERAADGSLTFTTLEVPNGKGLIAQYGMCVGPRFWWVSRSGIWESNGGEPTSITNDDLYPLFPHEGAQPGAAINGIFPPDYGQLASMRLCYADSSLYFIYQAINGASVCLRFDIDRRGWFPYSYTPTLALAYQEEGNGVDSVLLGSNTGVVSQIANIGADNGTPISCTIQTPADSVDNDRINKLFGDLFLDLNAAGAVVTVTPGLDEFTTFLAPYTLSTVGRVHTTDDILAGAGAIARNIGLIFTWTTAATPVMYGWDFSYVVKVEDTLKRATDWDNGGDNGLKFVQGIRLTADTQGLPVSLQIQGDAGVVEVAAVPATHNGQVTIAYNWTPFMSHDLRIVPDGVNPIRIYKVEWIYEPMPDFGTLWQTQGTTHDLPGFHHHRDAYIAVYSPTAGTVVLSVQGTGGTVTYNIPVTARLQQRVYLPLAASKSVLTAYSLSAGFGFAVFKKDCEMRVKAWGDSGPYQIKNPFGDISRADGARI